jgi:hypothetical protein
VYKNKREMYEVLRVQLENERSSFIPHWRDLGDYILPRRPRFFTSDVNKGDRRNQKIIDSTATLAVRTLRSGMMSGVTSPARPWFRLTTPDPALAENGPVKEWLYLVSQRMSTVFLQSNIYNALPIIYGDIGTFGTSALLVEEDEEYVIRAYPIPIGSYLISTDHRLKVKTFMREFKMTIRQLIDKFSKRHPGSGKIDWSNFSSHVQNQYEQGNYEAWIDVVHAIVVNKEFDSNKIDSKFKKYSSCYYEKGTISNGGNYMAHETDKFLRESGYSFFPVLCPRWETTGEDAYGTSCPGMDTLGDIKALQTMQRRKAQAVEKMVNPPMKGPSSLRTVKASILPGDITYTDEREGQKGFTPIHEVNPRIQELLADIQDTRRTISRGFFEDLFLMLAQSDRRQVTAREIDERHEEKLLALGPVLEQLNQDLLDPLIDNTFDIMMKFDMIPPPPQELQGLPLMVEYVSIMAQAQKLIGVSGVERFAGFVSSVAQFRPEVLDKINADQLIDVYADLTSVPPGLVKTDEEAAATRQQRAQAQENQDKMTRIQQGADAAKKLSETPMDEDSALHRLMNQSKAGEMVPTF